MKEISESITVNNQTFNSATLKDYDEYIYEEGYIILKDKEYSAKMVKGIDKSKKKGV